MAKKKVVKRKRAKAIVIPLHVIRNVDRGVRFLDMLLGRKEWLSRMDLAQFDIESPITCVAGNIFKNGMAGYDAFQQAMSLLHVSDSDGIRFGFNEDKDGDLPFLQDVWARRIKVMKKAHKMA